MDIDFPLVLTWAVLITGGVWLFDVLALKPRRIRAADSLEAQGTGAVSAEQLLCEPKLVEYSRSFFPVLLLVLFSSAVQAEKTVINDAAALADLKTGKGVFLVDIGDARKLNFYLEVIQGTYKGMKQQGVEPDFVLVYIGPSVKYLSTSPSAEVEKSAAGVLLEIESNVEALAELGVRQEICAVATRVFGIDEESVLPGLTLVGDGFISLIGYQAQGYHLVPVF